MPPLLYITPFSPAVRSVLLCAKALGMKLNTKFVDVVKGEHLTPEFIRKNPAGTLPTLIDDDDFILWESHAIMPYLADKYGKDDSLYPRDARQRAKVNEKLHFENYFLFARGSAIARPIGMEGVKEIKTHELERLQRAYEIIESFLKDTKYIVGDRLTIADFSYSTTLDTWAYFEPINESKYPKIHSYIKRMESLPYYKEINQEGRDVFYALMESKLKS